MRAWLIFILSASISYLNTLSLTLKILGSNAAVPAHKRNQTAQFLGIMHHSFLIDCGEATQLQMKKYKIKVNRVNHIFISHLHGDHYYGLMGLISSMHLFGRKKELYIYGPPGLMEIITLQLKYSETCLNYRIVFKEWMPGISETLIDNEHLTVSTIPLNHRVNCSGFLFREKPKKRRINKNRLPKSLTPLQIIALKNGDDITDAEGNLLYLNADVTYEPHPSFSYAYCSDTKYDESIITYIKGVDILYHEATFMDDMRDRAAKTYHTTTIQAAEIALKAQVEKLIIGHFSTRYKELNPLLTESRKVFKNTDLAIEGKSFELVDHEAKMAY